MRDALRRAVLVAALVTSTLGVAGAQTICDQLLPLGLVPPAGGFAWGCANRDTLRLGTGPGDYYWLAFSPCANGPCAGLTGPAQFVCEATSGHACCVSVPETIPLVAGNYTGPLRQGLDQRIANDTDPRAGICYVDYVGNGSRLGNVPLIRPIGNGVSHVEAAGFIRMFVTGPVQGTTQIPVEFVAEPTPVRAATWGRTKIRYH